MGASELLLDSVNNGSLQPAASGRIIMLFQHILVLNSRSGTKFVRRHSKARLFFLGQQASKISDVNIDYAQNKKADSLVRESALF